MLIKPGSSPTTNASLLTSGTIDDARLSGNVPLKNAANTFTAGPQTVAVTGDGFRVETGNGGIPLQIVRVSDGNVSSFIDWVGYARARFLEYFCGDSKFSFGSVYLATGGEIQFAVTGFAANARFTNPSSGLIRISANTDGTGAVDLEFGVTGCGPIIKSPNGTAYRIVVANDGTLSTAAV